MHCIFFIYAYVRIFNVHICYIFSPQLGGILNLLNRFKATFQLLEIPTATFYKCDIKMYRENIDEGGRTSIKPSLSAAMPPTRGTSLTYHISIQIHPASPLPRFEFSMRSVGAKKIRRFKLALLLVARTVALTPTSLSTPLRVAHT